MIFKTRNIFKIESNTENVRDTFKSFINNGVVLTEKNWAVSIVSTKKAGTGHAFLIIEGIKKTDNQEEEPEEYIIFRSDFLLDQNVRQRCSGSVGEGFIKLKELNVEELYDTIKDCSYQSYALSHDLALKLVKQLVEDSGKPHTYNFLGANQSSSILTSKSVFHNCASWCIEKIKNVGVETMDLKFWWPIQKPVKIIEKQIELAKKQNSNQPPSINNNK